MSDDMQPGPELDRMIAEKVMGWKPYAGAGTFLRPCGVIIYTNKSHHNPWSPSTRIDHAWEVVERMRTRGRNIVIFSGQEHNWLANIGGQAFNEFADTAPHAICLAALKAIGDTP